VPPVSPSREGPLGRSLMGHGAPAQLGVTIRRARLKDKTMSSILPSLLMSSPTVRAKDVEAPLFLRAFGVPFRAPARVFGRDTPHGRKPGGFSGPPPLSRLLAARPVDLRVPWWIPISTPTKSVTVGQFPPCDRGLILGVALRR
jgi:hypothetical protein